MNKVQKDKPIGNAVIKTLRKRKLFYCCHPKVFKFLVAQVAGASHNNFQQGDAD